MHDLGDSFATKTLGAENNKLETTLSWLLEIQIFTHFRRI